MPEELKLDEVREIAPEDLSEEQAGFLKENWGELTDEEKGAYGETLGIEEEEKEEEEEGKKKKKTVTLTEEEVDKRIENGVQKTLEARRKARLEEKERKKAEKEGKLPPRIFKEGYTASGWEEPARAIIDRAKEEIRGEDAATKEETAKRIRVAEGEIDEEIAKIREENPKLPKKGTKEGDDFETELAQISMELAGGLMPVAKAFEVWKLQQAVGKGGPGTKQKGLLTKISKGGGGEIKTKEKKKYSGIARDMDDAEERAVKKFKALS